MNFIKFSAAVAALASASAFGQSSLETGGSYDPAPASGAQRGVASTFAAATWSDDSIHLLDAGLAATGNFPAGTTDPNGAAAGNGLIYVVSFLDQEVVGFDTSGTEQVRWSAALSGAQGMAFVDGSLAIFRNGPDEIFFHDPADGTVQTSIDVAAIDGIEGLAYDGSLIWALADADLVGLDPADGSVQQTLVNPASGCQFDGTGLAFDGTSLVAGCTNGDWFEIDPATGAVTDSGNNTLNMYGLAPSGRPAPAPAPAVSVPVLSGMALAFAVMALLIFGMVGVRARSIG